MNKILFIVGSTGTGKTAVALKIADKFKGVLVSADSRQVYKGMDIGTGKDMPVNFKLETLNLKIKSSDSAAEGIIYYSDGETRIFGYDLVEPDEEFSVADWVRFAVPVVRQVWQDGKLPIVVGGTGLYIRALIRDLPEIFIPQNKKLREKLYSLSVDQLQNELRKLNSRKFSSMNKSDQSNPRRLVRAIEIEEWKLKSGEWKVESGKQIFSSDKLLIGLTADKDEIFQRIDKRVEARVKQGIVKEIQSLLVKGYTWELPSFSALGYDIWEDYFIKSAQISETEQKKLKKEIIQKWKLSEQQYAKRQLTWFKKEQGINWFDINNPDYVKRMLQRVEKWYNQKSSV